MSVRGQVKGRRGEGEVEDKGEDEVQREIE